MPSKTTTMTGENPSFVLKAIKEVSLENIPCPKIDGDYDVIVNIGQTGICGHVFERPAGNNTALTSLQIRRALLATRTHWRLCPEKSHRTWPRIGRDCRRGRSTCEER